MEVLKSGLEHVFAPWTDMLISGAACVLTGFLGFIMGIWWADMNPRGF